MRKQRFLIMSFIILVSSQAFAAGPPSEGERLAMPCAGCHGSYGASPGKMTPVIGGQKEDFIEKSLNGFADDTRPGSVMANFAKGYTEDQINKISTAVSKWSWVKTQDVPKKSGKKPSSIEMCTGCHGAKGEGTAMVPRIANQAASYLKDALSEYKTGSRKSPEMLMFKDMADKDINAMADYYSKIK